MTFPIFPLGQLFHHRQLATAGTTATREFSLHTTVDLNLNAGAAVLRNRRALFIGALTALTSVAGGARVPFTSIVDDAHAWDAATSQYVVPFDGLYLVNAATQISNAVPTELFLTPFDASVYNFATLASGLGSGLNPYDGIALPNVPMICAAGDRIAVSCNNTGGSSNFVGPNDGGIGYRSMLTIQYLGPFGTGALPASNPDDAPAELWVHGEPVSDVKLQRRFADTMNDLQTYLGQWGAQRAVFMGSADPSSVPNGSAVVWDPLIDNAGGLSSDGTTWQAPTPGIYAYGVALVRQDLNAAIQSSGDSLLGTISPAGGTSIGAATSLISEIKRISPADVGSVRGQFSLYPWATLMTPSNGFPPVFGQSYLAVTQLA